jgi:hypothetical protein
MNALAPTMRNAWENVPKAGAYAGKIHNTRLTFATLTWVRISRTILPHQRRSNAVEASRQPGVSRIVVQENSYPRDGIQEYSR